GEANRWADIGHVRRAEECGEAGIGRVRKKWVERVEIAAGAARVAGGVIESHAEARLKYQVGQRQSVVGGNGAGINVASCERAGLKDEIGVVVQKGSFAPKARAEGVADFMAHFSVKGVDLAIQRDVVAGPVVVLVRTSEAGAPFRLHMIGDGVNIRAKQN